MTTLERKPQLGETTVHGEQEVEPDKVENIEC